jgi:hypothetical protein
MLFFGKGLLAKFPNL